MSTELSEKQLIEIIKGLKDAILAWKLVQKSMTINIELRQEGQPVRRSGDISINDLRANGLILNNERIKKACLSQIKQIQDILNFL